jgi:hypothetical protein
MPTLLTGNFLHPSVPPIAIYHRSILPQGPLSVSPPQTQSCDLTFSFPLELGLSLLSSLGTGSPKTVEPSDGDVPLLSPEEPISWGHPPYLSSGQFSPWRLDCHKFPQTPHRDVSWATLGPFTSHLILNPERSFFSVIKPGPNIHSTMPPNGHLMALSIPIF